MVKNRGLCFFMPNKKQKKRLSTPASQNFPGPAYGPKVMIMVLKCSLKCQNFSSYWDFSKTIFQKSYWGSKKVGACEPPPLRVAGVNEIHCVNIYLIKAVVVIKFITFLYNTLWCSYSMLMTLPSMHICHIKRAISLKNVERGGMKFCHFFRPPPIQKMIFLKPPYTTKWHF